MVDQQMVELIELDKERKWEYLRVYYKLASKFYDDQQVVVSTPEVESAIQKFKTKPLPEIRRVYRLNDWKFNFDPTQEGLRKEYFSFTLDDSQWQDVSVPHSYQYIPPDPIRFGHTFFDIFNNGEEGNIWYAEYDTWYRSKPDVTPLRKNQMAYLKFESINLISDVWLNENPVMINHLGLFPYEMEVTEELNDVRDGKVCIGVRTRNIVTNKPWSFYNGLRPAYSNPPFTSGRLQEDWNDQAWSGIAGDATLQIVDQVHFEDAFIFTESIGENEASLQARLNLRNTSWSQFNGEVRVEISKWHPEESAPLKHVIAKVSVLPMNDTKLDLAFMMDDPDLWSMEFPNLYLAHIILMGADSVAIDDLYETFGIRTIQMVGTHFYLNNKKVILRGTHDIVFYNGDSLICPSDKNIVKDILFHKRLGANCSRWPSDQRMHYKRIADYCDQLGYMLSWAGYFEMWTVHPEMEVYANRDVKAMVKSLRNSPSVIIWEMGDEPLMGIHHYRRQKWYRQVYDLVISEDQSRPILPAGHFSTELVQLIENYPDQTLDMSERRRRVLAEYPLYNLKLAFWDFHEMVMHYPNKTMYEVVDRIAKTLEGQRPTIFTEFGIDALPELKKVLDVYGKFRWGASPYWNRSRDNDDNLYYEQKITADNWRETQASQAIVLTSTIGYLRENPDVFAGFYFMTLFDAWTYYVGIIDANGNGKLSYFAVRGDMQPVYLSGLHGSTVVKKGNGIGITAINDAEDISDATLNIRLIDRNGLLIQETTQTNIEIKGNVKVSTIGEFILLDTVQPDLYAIEYRLNHANGHEINRKIELFYLV